MKEQDCLRRFLFEELGVRGEWLRLEASWQKAKQYQKLSVGVQEKLGHALASAVLLSATIKYDGSMILQAQGNGDLKALVAQATHDRKIRVLARADENMASGSLSEMMGEGRLVITVEPDQGEPYQGIVSLEGDSLADVITRYFVQSEQLETRVWLFATETQVAGLFLQALPAQENDEADWERISALANTVTEQEMLTLDCEEMLFRLFNEEKVRVFEPEPVTFECGCSTKKIEKTLISLGKNELNSIFLERELIEVDCDFCGKQYTFDKVDVDNLLSGDPIEKLSPTRH